MKPRETGKYFVAMGAAIFGWRGSRCNSLPNSSQIITSNDSLFRRGFFTLDMPDLPQKITALIQWLSFRFVPLSFTPLDTRLKWGSFQRQKKRRDQHQLSVSPGLDCDKRNLCVRTQSGAGWSCVKKRNYEDEHTKPGYIFLIRAIQSRCA